MKSLHSETHSNDNTRINHIHSIVLFLVYTFKCAIVFFWSQQDRVSIPVTSARLMFQSSVILLFTAHCMHRHTTELQCMLRWHGRLCWSVATLHIVTGLLWQVDYPHFNCENCGRLSVLNWAPPYVLLVELILALFPVLYKCIEQI